MSVESSKPEVEVGDGTVNPVPATQAVQEAASILDSISAWPSHSFGRYVLRVVPGDGIFTHWRAKKSSARGRTMDLDTAEDFRVAVGEDIFATGVGNQLMNATGLPASVIAVQLLAHELFHLTELDRMSAAGVEYGQQYSGFAQGASADFEARWRSAAVSLANHYKMTRKKSKSAAPVRRHTLAAWRAADIASEACADLQSLQLMRRANLAPQAGVIQPALTALRVAQEAQALLLLPDAQGQLEAPPYQIGNALAALAPQLAVSNDLMQARSLTWAMSMQVALTDIYLPQAERDLIAAAAPPLVAASPSAWDKLKRAIGGGPS
jgi:hypothetical protein